MNMNNKCINIFKMDIINNKIRSNIKNNNTSNNTIQNSTDTKVNK